jgi:hypothetical protein
MDANELSATVLGLVLEGKLSPLQVPKGALIGQWGQAIEKIREHPEALGDKSAADSIIAQCLLEEDIRTAHTVASRHNGLGEQGVFEWVGSANSATKLYALGKTLDRFSKKAIQNDPIDLTLLYREVGDMLLGSVSGAQAANTIDYLNYPMYQTSGVPWMDKIIGGWPSEGLGVILAPQKTGKSYFQFYTTCMWLLAHPDKTAVIYTLEMSSKKYLARSLSMYPQFLPLIEAETPRLFISGRVHNVEELIAEVTTKKYDWVGIDDMSKLVKVQETSIYEKVYAQLNDVCRMNEIFIQVLAQPNREAKKANKFIDTYDAAWSGAAENNCSVLISLNRISPLDTEFSDTRFVPPSKENRHNTPRLYVCYWLFRDVRPEHAQQGDVGAVRLEPNKHTGLYDQIWVGEPLENKFFPAHYVRPTAIGTQTPQQQSSRPAIRLNKSEY